MKTERSACIILHSISFVYIFNDVLSKSNDIRLVSKASINNDVARMWEEAVVT